MNEQRFEHPIFGIFTYGSGTKFEHAYGILFERRHDGRITDYRLISFTGNDKPPSAQVTDAPNVVNSGVLMPITPKAAQQLIAHIEAIEKEMTATPPVRRHYFSDRIISKPDAQDSHTARHAKNLRIASKLMAGKHARPTNCVHFVMQAAMDAGIDLAQIGSALTNADDVESVTDIVDRVIDTNPHEVSNLVNKDGSPIQMRFASHAVGHASQALFFKMNQDLKNLDIFEVINAFPKATLDQISQTTPLMMTNKHARTIGGQRQSGASSVALGN